MCRREAVLRRSLTKRPSPRPTSLKRTRPRKQKAERTKPSPLWLVASLADEREENGPVAGRILWAQRTPIVRLDLVRRRFR